MWRVSQIVDGRGGGRRTMEQAAGSCVAHCTRLRHGESYSAVAATAASSERAERAASCAQPSAMQCVVVDMNLENMG